MSRKMVVVIPAYNPCGKLIELITQLNKANFTEIICVNDGSRDDEIFTKINDRCTVITHEVNRGKGCALKTAFSYIKDNRPECEYIITVDADGQHAVEDIKRCADKIRQQTNNTIVLGCRKFDGDTLKAIPWRSRFGNTVTRFITKYFCGLNISDTQTGLRAFGYDMIDFMLGVVGDRYEYEMNVLLNAKKNNINFAEIEIETIYEDGNSSSHFNPIIDSIKIYKIIIKYSISSAFSVIVDYVFFCLFLCLGLSIPFSTYGARAISSVANFYVNRSFVFNKKGNLAKHIILYYTQVIISATISAGAVYVLAGLLNGYEVLCKMLVDTSLFFLNYYVQKKLIFK